MAVIKTEMEKNRKTMIKINTTELTNLKATNLDKNPISTFKLSSGFSE
ncbi:hypothetical protein F7642_12420 [Tenacibaculum finnmarkense genomovar ulcerans]|nr:hypothetical protein [Tenacibaculum finnmarkense]MBE7635127.1 hypothetical protein [Tenacibaculum finnmarkense genomovar ulcerans]MCD8431080.1 hypothetical protein [Tenacibaculum finnmarkense genomovar ulcerans]